MGKPFDSELKRLKETIEWADNQELGPLKKFLEECPSIPLACIGSGGSYSACSYVTLLYRLKNGTLASSMTPLELMYSGSDMMRSTKLLFLSASGKNKDILTSIRYGAKYNECEMMALCLIKENPMSELLSNNPKAKSLNYEIPTEKDGFLATNSLVAFFAMFSRWYDDEKVSPLIDFDKTYETSTKIDFASIDNFVVLYGAYGEPVARDIESKLSEAALGATLISDYRNFGHGRHHWFAKRKERSVIIAIVSPNEKELATKTINCLPPDVPIIYIETSLYSPCASVDLLVKAFHFVSDLGRARGIDPGKPGVPSFGRLLYNMNYVKLTNSILPKEAIIDIAVKRKFGNAIANNEKIFSHFSRECRQFVNRLNKTTFEAIAFDYDGTLSGSDYNRRYKNELVPEVKDVLINILSKGIKVMIATGRGKSVKDILLNDIPIEYQPLVTIGYYNGSFVYNLAEKDNLSNDKNGLDNELKLLCTELELRLPKTLLSYKIEERNKQVSIEAINNHSDSNLIYTTCQEIIWNRKLSSIHVWQSTHSMDIVVYKKASKLNVLNGTVLCIGDYGSIEGNDYELLTTPYSLSVDQTSKDPKSCWNIAPSGVRGVDATLYYMKYLKLDERSFKCNFKI